MDEKMKKKMLCFEIDELKHRKIYAAAVIEGKTLVAYMNELIDRELERREKNEQRV
jgi:hypothetical protein